MAASGAKEISIVAQDITRYGTDIEGRCTLPALVRELSAVAGVEWLRLHYMHPRGLTPRLIDELYSLPKVLPYFDIPLQHISKRLLTAMNRHTSPEHLIRLIEQFASIFPKAQSETTFIVGFPGEQKRDFDELIDFIEEHPLDRVGAFAYSEEEGTVAEQLTPRVRPSTRQARLDQLMTLQQLIAGEQNQKLLNRIVEVIIDEVQPDRVLARTPGDAYEVDNTTTIIGKHDFKPGVHYQSAHYQGRFLRTLQRRPPHECGYQAYSRKGVAAIPFFMVAFFYRAPGSALEGDWGKAIATLIFIIAAITDYYDGYLARKYQQVTTFGRFMDQLPTNCWSQPP